MIVRETPIPDFVGDAQLTADFHCPHADFDHPRRTDFAGTALDQRRINSATAEIGCQRETNRTSADNQDRHF
jgi:hypothetical protein